MFYDLIIQMQTYIDIITSKQDFMLFLPVTILTSISLVVPINQGILSPSLLPMLMTISSIVQLLGIDVTNSLFVGNSFIFQSPTHNLNFCILGILGHSIQMGHLSKRTNIKVYLIHSCPDTTSNGKSNLIQSLYDQ